MKSILEKHDLGSLTQQFSSQRVTPDIVRMMSFYEFQKLQMNTSSEVMALQIECTKYGSDKPVKGRQMENSWKAFSMKTFL